VKKGSVLEEEEPGSVLKRIAQSQGWGCGDSGCGV
jgi:hypothetical protein